MRQPARVNIVVPLPYNNNAETKTVIIVLLLCYINILYLCGHTGVYVVWKGSGVAEDCRAVTKMSSQLHCMYTKSCRQTI